MFLKNKNIIFKIRRSKVTDYAALKDSAFNSLQDRICLQNSLGGGGGSKPILSHPSIGWLVLLLYVPSP